jgi:hypothetical protein
LAVFCGKVNPECRGTGKKGRKEPKTQESKVWLSPPREKGGETAKNLYGGAWEGGRGKKMGYNFCVKENMFPEIEI